MIAEVISVGSELLLGEITDTNATHICRRLADVGISVVRRSTVGDNLERLTRLIGEALQRSDALVIAGGLGPTRDDLTREAIAEALGRKLLLDPDAHRKLESLYRARGFKISDNSLRQAMIPDGGLALPNARGSAAGVWVELQGKFIAAVPGVPTEMETMIEEQVLPRLAAKAGGQQVILSRELHLVGMPESRAAEAVADLMEGANPTVAPLAGYGRVTLRITAFAESREEAERSVAEAEREIRARLGDYVYGTDNETLEAAIGRALTAAHATLSVAESCTGGWLGKRLTDTPGSSKYFRGAVVAYGDEAKINLLGVSQKTLTEHGAVSQETAQEMALGARSRFAADYALATTGIAGPEGGTPDKPVGLVYLALATPQGTDTTVNNFSGYREDVRWRTTQRALEMLWRRVR